MHREDASRKSASGSEVPGPTGTISGHFSSVANFFVSLCVLSGVVSVSFEEDGKGNLCLIAYPQSDPAADLENKDPLADSKPKSEALKWAPPMLADSENYSKDARSRHSAKDKDER